MLWYNLSTIRKDYNHEVYFKSRFEYQEKKDARIQKKDEYPLGARSFKEKKTEGPPQAYPKKERLVKTKDFGKVYKAGRSSKIDFAILKVLPNTLTVNRLGFSIGSKSIKQAYRRNRIKRLFREAYRKNKKALKKGFDMVLVVRKDPAKDMGYNEAEKIFLKLAKNTGVL
jgi:ribonuclease P protein component